MKLVPAKEAVSLGKAPAGILLTDYGLFLKISNKPDGSTPWHTQRLDGVSSATVTSTLYECYKADTRPRFPLQTGENWFDKVMVFPVQIEG